MTDYSPPDIEDPGLPRTSLTELKVLLNSITTSCGRKWDIILELDDTYRSAYIGVMENHTLLLLLLINLLLLLLLLLLVGGVHQGSHGKRRGSRKEESRRGQDNDDKLST